MKKPSRFLRLIGVAGLLATLLAGVFATPIVYAGEPDPDPSDDGTIGSIWDGSIDPLLQLGPGGIYYPWVGNDDESTGLGPADTSVSVMNISDDPAVAFAWVGSHDTAELPDTGGWDIVGPFFLAPWASKTFTAAQLGIAEGTGAPVAFAGYNQLWTEGGTCTTNLGGPLSAGNDVNGNGECTDVEVLVTSDPYYCAVDDANGDPAPEVGGDGLNADGDCVDSEGGKSGGIKHIVPTVLGGIAKQAVDGETLPFTTAADSSVSGYNAVGGFELGEFDDWYFPIVQTNGGPGGPWDTILRIANFGNIVDGEVGNIGSAAVTARFFPADDAQGSLNTGFQLQALVNSGDVWTIDVSDYVPEGWVGSVHVYSDSNVFAMADRVKLGYSAWITNTASNSPYTNDNNMPGALGQYVLFAPDVRLDFFGWNTGINVANLVNDDNNVNIQYFNLYGNAPTALTRRLAPQGMTYFYDPSQAPQDNSLQDPTTDVNADIIGSALIWSDYPVAVAVDATKYPESTNSEDPNIFQAMSYSATANVYTTQVHPLVQKGNPTTGQGATSGINIMNPNPTAALASVWWVNPSGFGADNYGTSAVAIPGFANGFVYTFNAGNLPNGFYGSAVVTSTLPVASVTTQVDYQVEWDGTAVWLGYNPCGYYRDNGGYDLSGFGYDTNCNLGDPFNTSGGQVTKYFHDENGEEITGAFAELWNEAYYQQEYLGNESFAGIPWAGYGYSDVDGVIEWTNVPVGTYYLYIGDLPEGNYDYMYEGVGNVEGPFTLNEGEDIVLENQLDRILPHKYVYLGSDAGGMEVCLHADDNADGDLDPDEVTSPEYCDVADGDGYVEFWYIEPGWYFVSANGGFGGNAVINGFNSPAYVSGAEYFGLGGEYYNYLEDQFGVAEGHIQKVLNLPEFLLDDVIFGSVNIEGDIQIYDGDGNLEVEGDVQMFLIQNVGPNDDDGWALTDFNVPVGGPYTIVENFGITYDLDGPGGDPPTTVFYSNTLTTAVDGQVICDDYLDLTSTCDPSAADPQIYVYEDKVTRVFNDLTNIVVGQFDVFVRDEDTDLPLNGAEVCLFDVNNVLFAPCATTDATGIASFAGVPDGTYTVNAAAVDYEGQASTNVYNVVVDSANGGLADSTEATADVVIALDPGDAILDAQVFVNGNLAPGQTVFLSPASAVDGPGSGPAGSAFCANAPTQLQVSDANGEAEFTVQGGDDYCVGVIVGGFLGQIAVNSPVQVPSNDPNTDIDTVLSINFGDAVLDVQVIANLGLGDIGTGVHFVQVFVANGGDVYGNNGSCAGALVDFGFTTSTGFGMGVFSTPVTAGAFCVAANSADGLGGGDPTVSNAIIVAGDPIGDIDVTINTT